MSRTAVIVAVLIAACAVNAQEVTTHHPEERGYIGDRILIGDQIYWLSTTTGTTFESAEYVCLNQTMVMVGFEFRPEYDLVVEVLFVNSTYRGSYWTNGKQDGDFWRWGNGETFDERDNRWAQDEPGNPPTNLERISVNGADRRIYSDSTTVLHRVMCEVPPKPGH